MAETKPKFAVELKAGAVSKKYPTAAFMAGDKRVVLSADDPRFETNDEAIHAGLLDLPFLKDASGAKEAGS